MPDRGPATDDGRQQETAEDGYFASLASARSVLLTTFRPDSALLSVPVRGVIDGDRAFIGTRSRPGRAKQVQHADAVQVTPCSMRGLCTTGPSLDATARLLHGEEASRVAGLLADKYPVRQRFLVPLLDRVRRHRMAHFELLADEAAEDHDAGTEAGSDVAHGDQGHPPLACAQAEITDCGVSAIACIWSPAVRGGAAVPG